MGLFVKGNKIRQEARLRNGFLSSSWSGREDLNLRPLQPHCSALPGCATPRHFWNEKSIAESYGAVKRFFALFSFSEVFP